MVKKIRVVEEERSEEELSTEEFQAKMLEYMHTMDWKLWEMLKLMNNHLGKENLEDDTNDKVEETVVKANAKAKKGPKPVIVDEDD